MDGVITIVPCPNCTFVDQYRHPGHQSVDSTWSCQKCGFRRDRLPSLVPTVPDVSRNMESRGRSGYSREPPRSRSYGVAERPVQRQRSQSPRERRTNYRHREYSQPKSSSSAASSPSSSRNPDASKQELSRVFAESYRQSQHLKASASPNHANIAGAKVCNVREIALPPKAPRAMREERKPPESNEDSSSGHNFAVVDTPPNPRNCQVLQSFVHLARSQNIVVQPKKIKEEGLVGEKGEDLSLLKVESKSSRAIGYHSEIGQEDWCLSCHVNGHRAPNCPGPPKRKIQEDQRNNLLDEIPSHYILSTGCVEPKTVRNLVKEVLIHVLDTDGHKKHVAKRDQFFGQLFAKMAGEKTSPCRDIWFKFMSSINHGMRICAIGLAKRPLPILRDALRVRHMKQDEDLDDFVARLFAGDAEDDPAISTEMLETVRESLNKPQASYENWMKKWDFELHECLEECHEFGRLESADKDWIRNAFTALKKAQPQFEYRNSRWIQHLWYPDINTVEGELHLR